VIALAWHITYPADLAPEHSRRTRHCFSADETDLDRSAMRARTEPFSVDRRKVDQNQIASKLCPVRATKRRTCERPVSHLIMLS
jgi:hypothetical protein